MRRKMYLEAKASFDISVRVAMNTAGATSLEDVYFGIWCDECGERIRGQHYKCASCDWNYDLCQTCFVKSTHSHSPQNIMMIPSKQFSVDGKRFI